MKRSLKNIIMIAIIISLGICSYFTMKEPSTSQTTNKGEMQQSQGTPPGMPSGDSNSNNTGTAQGMPSGDSNSNNTGTPPEKPSGDSNSNNTGTASEMPSGNSSSNNMGTPPSNAQGQNGMQNQENETKIETGKCILLGVEGLIIAILITYMALSRFNKLTLKETLKSTETKIIFKAITILLTTLLTIGQIYIAKNIINKTNSTQSTQMMPQGMNNSSQTAEATGEKTVTGETETLSEKYTTSESDKSAILVEDGGNATIEGATISKTGGDSTNIENSEFYGINSGILVTKNSTATIKNATIETNAKGSNAVFSTGTDSKIYISDSTIKTTGSSSSRGLDATYGGYIEAENVEITTQGGSCATLATDRGEGTVIAKDSKLETNGSGSPVIYSTGDISIENTEGTANGAQMVVIEGKNTATVTKSTLTASGTGNRGETDQAGIMIYQSMSGDAGEGTGTFTATNSNLSIQTNSKYYKTAPMFFITNTDAIINLKNCKLSYGSNTLISSKGTTEWGTTGSNGGNLTLNAEDQTLEGNIEIDNISTLKMNLTNSEYTGTINAENTAKQIDLKIDSNTKIKLTGDSYVTSLEDDDTTYSNIDFNGYTLYVNGTAIN